MIPVTFRNHVYRSVWGSVVIPTCRAHVSGYGVTYPIEEAERMEHYSAVVQLRKLVKYLAHKPTHKLVLALCLVLPGGILLWFGYQWLNRRAR